MTELLHNVLTESIIGALIEVHRELGPGLLESAHEECLCFELSQRRLEFQRQVPISLRYKSIRLNCGYFADVVVERNVLLELKSVESLAAVHDPQLLTYLRLTGIRVGLLVNFNVPYIKDGITRRIL
jgi:GxxExxY protein